MQNQDKLSLEEGSVIVSVSSSYQKAYIQRCCVNLKKRTVVTSNRVAKTICIMAAILGMGLAAGVNGPTLVHMEKMLGTYTERMGFVLCEKALATYLVHWYVV